MIMGRDPLWLTGDGRSLAADDDDSNPWDEIDADKDRDDDGY